MNLSISTVSRLRVWIARRSVGVLLLMWLVLYAAVGFVFAIAYYVAPQCAVASQSGNCEKQFWNLVFFSFTTQSTVGYGDYIPLGTGRWLSVVQAFLGLTLNALVLGVVVFKALKRSNPLVFPNYLVYEVARHSFWFRFVNRDKDQIRDVEVKVQFVQPSGPGNVLAPYDTLANSILIDIPQPFHTIPPLRMFAYRSQSNDGQPKTPIEPLKPLALSPAHFSGTAGSHVEVTIRGYFESTGDVFYYSRRYQSDAIRCGAFSDVDNNALETKSDSEKARELSAKLDKIISTNAATCLQCPHHNYCMFDISVKTQREASKTGP